VLDDVVVVFGVKFGRPNSDDDFTLDSDNDINIGIDDSVAVVVVFVVKVLGGVIGDTSCCSRSRSRAQSLILLLPPS